MVRQSYFGATSSQPLLKNCICVNSSLTWPALPRAPAYSPRIPTRNLVRLQSVDVATRRGNGVIASSRSQVSPVAPWDGLTSEEG